MQRGLLLRLHPGAYVERTAFESLDPEQQHVVRIRAVVAASDAPLLVSHWSAAVLHGLPVLRTRLDAVHVTVPEEDDRHRHGLVTHRFEVGDAEVVRRGELLVTTLPRTVVDVAGASPFEEGVMASDAALFAGTPREALEAAADAAGARRAFRRIADVIAFAHPGGESAAESRMRVSIMRNGFEVPELQHRVRLRRGGSAWLDGLLPTARVGLEADGEQKYLDAELAPEGPGRAVLREKQREDEVRLGLTALVRPGWVQTGSAAAMRTLLARVGVRPTRPRTPLIEYARAARLAVPRPHLR